MKKVRRLEQKLPTFICKSLTFECFDSKMAIVKFSKGSMPTYFIDFAKHHPYPGRFIILGKQAGDIFVIYGVTARNASSRAKRYVFSPDLTSIHVEATDAEIMSQGNLDLLDYTALRFFENGLVIGNGRQVDCIKKLNLANATEQLNDDLQKETFEPDKYSTPRITGCLLKNSNELTASLCIIRNDGANNSVRKFFPIDLTQDGGQFISTYSGQNVRPAPSFVGDPVSFKFPSGNVDQIAEYVYTAFAPESAADDLRVSIVAVCVEEKTLNKLTCIINKSDRQS